MKTVILSLAVFATSTVNAKPMAEAIKRLVPKAKVDLTAQCADFTGTWQGSCTYHDGSVEPETLVIDQMGCQWMDLTYESGDVESIILTGQKNQSESSPTDGAIAYSISSRWNDSMQKVEMIASGTNTDPTLGLGTLEGNMEYFMEDGLLNSNYELNYKVKNNGVEKKQRYSESCQYQKIN
jgi:hypothetical protein